MWSRYGVRPSGSGVSLSQSKMMHGRGSPACGSNHRATSAIGVRYRGTRYRLAHGCAETSEMAGTSPAMTSTSDDRRGNALASAGRGLSPGSADRSHLPAVSASAEELIAAIGFEPRHTRSTWHLEPFQNLSGSRIDAPHIALVTFPGAVPEFAVDPGDPGDDAVRLDRAKDRARLGIDLMDLAVPMLAHPERPFGPRQPRVTAAAGRRDRGHHTAGLRIDFLDAILGDLKQVLAVEGRSRMRGDIDRAHHRSARRIEGVQPVSGRKPDVPTVKRDPMDLVGIRKGSILAEDFGCRSFHASILVTGQWTGE